MEDVTHQDYTKIGFTGTRNGMSTFQKTVVSAILNEMDKGQEVHHGDCIGADAEFHAFAARSGYKIVVHPPIHSAQRAFCVGTEERPAKDFLSRNRNIVHEVDIMIAVPQNEEPQNQGGTWYTIRYAMQVGKPCVVLYPSGKIELLNNSETQAAKLFEDGT